MLQYLLHLVILNLVFSCLCLEKENILCLVESSNVSLHPRNTLEVRRDAAYSSQGGTLEERDFAFVWDDVWVSFLGQRASARLHQRQEPLDGWGATVEIDVFHRQGVIFTGSDDSDWCKGFLSPTGPDLFVRATSSDLRSVRLSQLAVSPRVQNGNICSSAFTETHHHKKKILICYLRGQWTASHTARMRLYRCYYNATHNHWN